MPDTRPDMRQRALFVKSNAARCWNKMLLTVLVTYDVAEYSLFAVRMKSVIAVY